MEEATGAFGKLRVKIPSGIQTLGFTKQKDEEWLTRSLDQGGEAKLRFDRNLIQWKAGQHPLMNFTAFDAEGRQLKYRHGPPPRDGGQGRLCWGQPAKAQLVISQESLERTFPFEMLLPEADREAFAKYKQQIANRKKVYDALKKISSVSRRASGEALAGLYYLHDLRGREEDRKPLKLIPIEVAHACPEGAERFGYEVKPYAGYFFSVLGYKMQQGKKTPYQRPATEAEYQWEKGKFKALPFWEPPGIVAYPQDPSSPTFIVSWSSVYMKELGGKRPEAFPESPHKEKWAQVRFLKD